MVRILKGIQSPHSSDKENRPIFQSPIPQHLHRSQTSIFAPTDGPAGATPSSSSESISIHPQILNCLAQQLQQSERKIQHLQTELTLQKSTAKKSEKEVKKENRMISARKEERLKALIRQLNQIVDEDDEQDKEEGGGEKEEEEEEGIGAPGGSRSFLGEAATEPFHRYSLIHRKRSDEEEKEEEEAEEEGFQKLQRPSDANVNLLQRFTSVGGLNSSELDEEIFLTQKPPSNHSLLRPMTGITTTRSTSAEFVFDSTKKRKYGFLESSEPQYIYGSPQWKERIETWEKRRVKSQQETAQSEQLERQSTPSIFDHWKKK